MNGEKKTYPFRKKAIIQLFPMRTEEARDSAPPLASDAAALRADLAVVAGHPSATGAGARLMSVDALRGFDMFWIIGAGALVQAFEKMSENAVTRFLSTQLQHVQWEGFRFYDLIFPLFLFIMGVSMIFSLGRALDSGGRPPAVRRIVRRSALLFALGVFYHGGVSRLWPDVQLGGVLQRIALCYLFAALTYCFVRSAKGLAAVGAALLIGYWALLTFVTFPDLAGEIQGAGGRRADRLRLAAGHRRRSPRAGARRL